MTTAIPRWLAITTAGVSAALALTGCGAVTGETTGSPAQAEKGQAADKSGPGYDPKATVDAYGVMVADFVKSRGETLNGKQVTGDNDVREGFSTLACPQIADGQINTYQRFARMRERHPDAADPFWNRIGETRPEVRKFAVNGETASAEMVLVTAQGDQTGQLSLQKNADGRWEVCLPPGQPQPGA